MTASVVGFGDEYGLLIMDDWKETLIPFIGLTSGDGGFVDKSAVMRKLRCPQIVHKADGARANGQYALNASGTARFSAPSNFGLGGQTDADGIRHPTVESQVSMPADMVGVGDIEPGATMDLVPGVSLKKFFLSSGRFDVCSTNRSLWPGATHRAQANMLFCDGHIESRKQTDWLANTDAARSRWNNDHLPHPETWNRP
jgi:prepilin-type processing-associated H-X9-DG protein